MTQRIVRWTDGGVIWEGDAATVKDALHAAIKARADLSGADLSRAKGVHPEFGRAETTVLEG